MPFEVPKGWVWTTLGEIAESNIGLTYKPSDICNDGVPVYRSNNIQGVKIDTTDIVRVQTTILDKQFLKEGDLLICARNGSRRLVGKNAIIRKLTEKTAFGAFMAVCRSKYNPWLHLLLQTSYFDKYLDESNSTAINQVTQSMLLALNTPLPPLAEQQRIVAEIERWFALIDTIEQGKVELQTAIKQTKSKILDLAIHGKLVPQDPSDEPASELLKRINPKAQITCDNEHSRKLPKGWCNTTLANMCNTTNGLWKGKKPPFVKVGVIRNANFTKYFTLDYSKIEYIDVEQRAFEKKHLLHGDLIVEKSGGSDKNPVGRAIFFDGEDGLFSFSNFTMCLRCKDQTTLMSKYLFYLLLCIYSRGDMVAMQTQTTGLHNLLVEKFMAMTFPLPPFAEQKRIVQKIEELFSLLDCIEKALQA